MHVNRTIIIFNQILFYLSEKNVQITNKHLHKIQECLKQTTSSIIKSLYGTNDNSESIEYSLIPDR